MFNKKEQARGKNEEDGMILQSSFFRSDSAEKEFSKNTHQIDAETKEGENEREGRREKWKRRRRE
jgi:hypothetical protein